MNTAKLEYEMKVNGVTKAELCNVLDMSRTAFYRKCHGKSEFTQSEIQKIVDYLHLDYVCSNQHTYPCSQNYLQHIF